MAEDMRNFLGHLVLLGLIKKICSMTLGLVKLEHKCLTQDEYKKKVHGNLRICQSRKKNLCLEPLWTCNTIHTRDIAFSLFLSACFFLLFLNFQIPISQLLIEIEL